MPRRSRTTTPQQPTLRPARARVSSMPLVVGIPAEILRRYSEEQQQEIARAQVCYQLRQSRLDPRIPAYYNGAPLDGRALDDAVRVLMGLFDAKAMPEVTLEGALAFASALASTAMDAEYRRQQPALPMPYRYLIRRELDEMDALYGVGVEAEERLTKSQPRRRSTKRSKTTTKTDEVEVSSHERQARRRTTTRATKAQTVEAAPREDPATALPVVRRGGRTTRTGPRHGAHVSQALRTVAR